MPFPQRGRHGAGAVADAELAVDRPQVGLDGLVADDQLGGDGAVGKPVDDERQDLAFALCQPLPGPRPEFVALQPRRRVDRPRGHARVDRGLAAVHELELTDQLVAADALQQIARRADAQRLEEVLLVVVDRQHHDLALRVPLAQLQAQVQPAGPLHADVAQHDVGVELVDHAERPLSADGLSDHLYPVLERREHRLEALDDHLVVIDQHKPHRMAIGRHGTTLELGFRRVEELGLADPPIGGGPMAVRWATLIRMPTTQEKSWRAGRFWWDATAPTQSVVYPLRAVIFDLDALTDIECDGHRVAFNAAFAAHGLDFQWSVGRYRQLLALSDERQRVSAELRKRGIATECDVLTELLADEIYATKTMMFEELIRDADLAPRPGLVDLVMDAFAAGVWVGVVDKRSPQLGRAADPPTRR